jgi:uncharacterized protein (TIGR02996 family)
VTVTTTIAAMLAAVKAAPDDDTPRLALADVLAETDPGEGGDAAWAEFIRVQCELARTDKKRWYRKLFPRESWDDLRPELQATMRFDPPEAGKSIGVLHYQGLCDKWKTLRARSDALLTQHEARWRRGPKCKWCEGKGRLQVVVPEMRIDRDQTCDPCHGTGHAGPLGEKVLPDGHMMPRAWRVPADFRRGFIARVSTPLADVFAGDDVTDWAVRVARWPQVCLEEWGLTDREPHESAGSVWEWYEELTGDEDEPSEPDDTPRAVWLAMANANPEWARSNGFLECHTPDAARLALAKAVAATVNEAAHD